jgi:hypothetical protein
VTVSVPAGAAFEGHEAEPAVSAAVVHSVVEPTVNVTVPLGGPGDPETVAEYVTVLPHVTLAWST